ncbi:MAG: B12-binding domain-containing radical SAM protein [Acutalibacteraceae bacterium]
MVQPNSQYGNSIYFPYAAGSLIAYAFENETVRENYAFRSFIYKKTDIASVVSSMDNPFLVGFSCYVWNFEYNKTLASAVKKAFPDCQIVFGGHQVSEKDEALLSDFCDYVILGEGEDSFLQLLLYLNGDADLQDIPGLMYRREGAVCRTERAVTAIPERVSPYLRGYFDELVEKETLEFSAILETNRGCPNRCAFCDWGNIKSKVKQFDTAMVKAEIDWMSEHKIEYCYCSDANFGLFARDEEFIDYMIQKHEQTGYPQKFQATYSKNNPQTVFRINKRINDSGMSKGATLSFQSMTQSVLDNIYRKNMPLEKFNELMTLYNSNGIPAYSEIILGLPGESYETFRDGIEDLLECGQHMAINFFNCELLKNSIMSDPAYIEKYNIRSVRTEQHQYHVVPDAQAIREYSDIVVSTCSMTPEMWIRCNILSVFVRTFHNLGLLQCIAIYLYYEKNVQYMDFYESLIAWAEDNPESVLGQQRRWLFDKYTEILNGGGSLTCTIPQFGKLTWPLEEGVFLNIILEYETFYTELADFLGAYFEDNDLFCDLLRYQKAVVKTPYTRSITLDLQYDFYAFFSKIYAKGYEPLRKAQKRICLDASDVSQDLEEYAEKTIWYGRKGGKNIISDIRYLQ